jgi:hypothetical protein
MTVAFQGFLGGKCRFGALWPTSCLLPVHSLPMLHELSNQLDGVDHYHYIRLLLSNKHHQMAKTLQNYITVARFHSALVLTTHQAIASERQGDFDEQLLTALSGGRPSSDIVHPVQ